MVELPKRPVLDDAKRREVIAIIANGCSRRVAAQYVGCHYATIGRTAKRDPAFAEQLRRAETQQEIRQLRNVNAAAEDARYWRAAAWALERLRPERYSQRRTASISVDQLAQALAELADMVCEAVSEAAYRQRISEQVDAQISRLETLAIEARHDD